VTSREPGIIVRCIVSRRPVRARRESGDARRGRRRWSEKGGGERRGESFGRSAKPQRRIGGEILESELRIIALFLTALRNRRVRAWKMDFCTPRTASSRKREYIYICVCVCVRARVLAPTSRRKKPRLYPNFSAHYRVT